MILIDNNELVLILSLIFVYSQEFECGVSVAGSDRQEWSFTLYDFDGRGNITKDVSKTKIMKKKDRKERGKKKGIKIY